MKAWLSWILAMGLSIGCWVEGVEARTLYVLDFDGSINNDHSQNPAWKTRWILFRVRDLRSLLQRSPEDLGLPETIEISYGEYVRLRPLLGKGEAILGDLRPQPLEKDPVWKDRPAAIIPGYYYIDANHSFKYYRPGRSEKNYLLKDYQDAVTRHERLADSDGFWGEAFPLLQKALSSKDSVGDLVILTARHHLAREFMSFLEALKADGFVRHTSVSQRGGRKITPRFFSMHAPEALAFGRQGLPGRKAEAVMSLSRQFLESHDGEEHMELSPDPQDAGKGVVKLMHTVIVAEDTPANLEAIRKMMEALSAELGFQSRMKFVLFNTASDEVVARSRWPYRWTVFHHGFGRPATDEEIKQWTTPNGESNCEGALK